MITVIDNVLSDDMCVRFEELAKKVALTKELLPYTSPTLPGELKYSGAENYDIGQHVYKFGRDSQTGLNEFVDAILKNEEVAQRLKGKGRSRTKINYIPEPTEPSDEVRYHNPHVDTYNPSALSCVYYINDTDIGTFIYNETYDKFALGRYDELTLQRLVEPKHNRMVVFPAKFLHSAGYPRRKERVILNMVFE